MQRGHAEALMPMLGRVMQASGVGFADLDRIAVTTGPGSFTGLRVGLSAARGIALAAAKPVVGLTTLSAYAAPLVSERDDTPILSAIDARHDHVYYQLVSGNGTRLVKPRVGPISEALDAARHGRAAAGRQCGGSARRALAGADAAGAADRSAAGARHLLGGVARCRGDSGGGSGAAVLSARARRQAADRRAGARRAAGRLTRPDVIRR